MCIRDRNRDDLEFLFDVFAERTHEPESKTVNGMPDLAQGVKDAEPEMIGHERFLHLNFFMKKLYKEHEQMEVDDVEATLRNIKAALVYKRIDFGRIFAENTREEKKKVAGPGSKGPKTQQKEIKESSEVDMTCHYTRLSQQLVKEEFVKRVEKLQAAGVTRDKIIRLANYLSLN